MKILITAGTRPNFVKLAPLMRSLNKEKYITIKLVHTGQHYSYNMTDIFFKELDIPTPDYNIKYDHSQYSNHGGQTGIIMIEFEKICLREKPDLVIIIGDVNSTLACGLVASKLHIKIAHIEAGYRSYDKNIPEEINRVISDYISDYLFCSEIEPVNNLKKENNPNKIFLVGDLMIDNLFYNLNKISDKKNNKEYILVTIHRQSNINNINNLKEIINTLNILSKQIKIIFPIHPHTLQICKKNNLYNKLKNKNIELLNPQSYLTCLKLIKNSKLIITDSGGIQTESSLLNIPCITIRDITELKSTVLYGTNIVIGKYITSKHITSTVLNSLNNPKQSCYPNHMKKLMDGKTSNRIVEKIKHLL